MHTHLRARAQRGGLGREREKDPLTGKATYASEMQKGLGQERKALPDRYVLTATSSSPNSFPTLYPTETLPPKVMSASRAVPSPATYVSWMESHAEPPRDCTNSSTTFRVCGLSCQLPYLRPHQLHFYFHYNRKHSLSKLALKEKQQFPPSVSLTAYPPPCSLSSRLVFSCVAPFGNEGG
jgi:hypothetical protein